MIALFGTATQVFLSRGTGAVQNGTRQTKIIGSDRLVSVETLAETDGQICVTDETAPDLIASLQPQNLLSTRRQQARASSTLARPSDAIRAQVAARKPVSTLRDPRNAFTGLVIDPTRNEVVIAEENNFSLLVHDRMEHTPPRAALSEPKRMILTGISPVDPTAARSPILSGPLEFPSAACGRNQIEG
ncbi:MAG: hypothetical protein DMG14_14885 [Acidobacteria bacterium]|nr:MAG: hypothetical protein DMG14_14885 [Acidobacteriota bacterium]